MNRRLLNFHSILFGLGRSWRMGTYMSLATRAGRHMSRWNGRKYFGTLSRSRSGSFGTNGNRSR